MGHIQYVDFCKGCGGMIVSCNKKTVANNCSCNRKVRAVRFANEIFERYYIHLGEQGEKNKELKMYKARFMASNYLATKIEIEKDKSMKCEFNEALIQLQFI